jgi:hypothetical protein
VPLSAVAATCGVSRLALYRVSDDMAELLSPIVRACDAGKLRFRGNGRYGDGANRREIIES